MERKFILATSADQEETAHHVMKDRKLVERKSYPTMSLFRLVETKESAVDTTKINLFVQLNGMKNKTGPDGNGRILRVI